MTYRPYPNRARAEKYATGHGVPSGWSRPFRVRPGTKFTSSPMNRSVPCQCEERPTTSEEPNA